MEYCIIHQRVKFWYTYTFDSYTKNHVHTLYIYSGCIMYRYVLDWCYKLDMSNPHDLEYLDMFTKDFKYHVINPTQYVFGYIENDPYFSWVKYQTDFSNIFHIRERW